MFILFGIGNFLPIDLFIASLNLKGIKSFVKSNVWGVFEAGQSTFKKGQPIDCYNPLGSNKNIFL